jgi:hypothetical protein
MDSERIISRRGLPAFALAFAMALAIAIALSVLAVQASSVWSGETQRAKTVAVGSGSFGAPYTHVGGHWGAAGLQRFEHGDGHRSVTPMWRRIIEAKKSGTRP